MRMEVSPINKTLIMCILVLPNIKLCFIGFEKITIKVRFRIIPEVLLLCGKSKSNKAKFHIWFIPLTTCCS